MISHFLLAFVFGSIIGSFFNVLVLRKNTGERIVQDRSRCFSCAKTLLWYDNIPLVSFFVLRARCRFCRSKISWQYPLIELIAGIIVALVYVRHANLDVSFFLNASLLLTLFLVALYDFRTKIIESHFLRIFAGFSILVAVYRFVSLSKHLIFLDIGIAALMWFFFWALWFFSDGTWMGRGDSSVVFWCSLLLGFPISVGMLLVSFWIGGALGIVLLLWGIWRKKKHEFLRMELPFAPFLALGTFISWFFEAKLTVIFSRFF